MMNLPARILSIALPLLGQTLPALASDMATNPGGVANLVSMSDSALDANKIKKILLGDVVLTSGHIVATDLLVQPKRIPFLVTVPPGRYPVTLFEAEGRIAAATMRFAGGDPVRWQLAVVEGQDIKTLKPNEYFGYGVDTGLGCYMDRETAALIDKRDTKVQTETDGRYISYYDDVLSDELAANGDDYLLHQPIADKPGNVAIFSSGWGDGFYPVYWGLNAEGTPIVILTDFQVISTLVEAKEGEK
jgi:hypothetical protein